MQVLVNSDHHITGSESVAERVDAVVRAAVDRFEGRITRVEVHLNDVNGPKHGDDEKRCMMEARVGGVRPIAVTHQAATLVEAIDKAAEKLERALEHTLARLAATAGPAPREAEIASIEDLQALEEKDKQRTRAD